MMVLVRVYLLSILMLSLAGALSAAYPIFDIANYFRPWLLLASLPALFLFLSRLQPALTRTLGLIVLTLNATLLFYPVLTNPSGLAPTKEKVLKLVSLNVWQANQKIDRVAEFLESEQADIVLLQEMHDDHLSAIKDRLRKKYPFIHTCDCRNLVLLSRYPWQVAGGNRLTSTKPAMIWARFAKPGRGTFRVVGVHTAAPHYPTIHVQHMRWLAEHLSSGERLIIGGDFNATPWSTRLMRMAAQHNLQRAMTFSWSWPSIIYPLLLIDNFYVSNLLQIRSSKIGPDVGSDHRPVVMKIAIPS
ncbi:MAG: endonuclease/exonuclease/phosphatase family protein [Pseudomonadota bacterium]